jgi:hypothetical protein
MTDFELQTITGEAWPAVLAALTAERDAHAAINALLKEHQDLVDQAVAEAGSQIERLAQAGADVSGLVAILNRVSTPVLRRRLAVVQADAERAAAELAAKRVEIAALQAKLNES